MSSFPENLADRFRRFKQRHFLPNAEQYEELATYGQTPDAMIISCSDSRVDPETIFGAMPGELFVVRNVANLVPPYETGGKFHGVSSAIEFAVLNLRVKDLIVMGHSGCGGVKAALDQSAAIQTEVAIHLALDVDAGRGPPQRARFAPDAAARGKAARAGEGRREDRDQEFAHVPVHQPARGQRAAVLARGLFRHRDGHAVGLEPLAQRVLPALTEGARRRCVFLPALLVGGG